MRIKPGMEATLPCEPELGPLYLTERVELTGLQENPERNALRGTALEWVRCAHAQTLRPTRQRLACHPVLPRLWWRSFPTPSTRPAHTRHGLALGTREL